MDSKAKWKKRIYRRKTNNFVNDHFRNNVSVNENKISTRYCMIENLIHKLSENRHSSVARLRNVVQSMSLKGMLENYHGIILE